MMTLSYASFTRRLGAAVLDGMIVGFFGLLLHAVLPGVAAVLIWFAYAPFLESSALQATIGKKLLGIQVCGPGGEQITFRAAMIRAFVKLVSSALAFLPHLLALFTERKQALHDLLAGTVVQRGRAEISVVDAWVQSVKSVFSSSGIPSAAASAKLSELERLQSLYEKGALTRAEFEAEKKRILD